MAQSHLSVTIDLLNNEHFMQVIERAIDVVNCSEKVLNEVESASTAELRRATERFRLWFEQGE